VDAGRIGEALETARELGFLGPGPVQGHIDHALTLAGLIGTSPPCFLDLGSGGGVPGLVLADHWRDADAVLVDAGERRCGFLEEAVVVLGLAGRVAVRCGRAEDLARDPILRAAFPLVVARGFGAPPVVAECSVGFLTLGGKLIVTEPPASEDPLEVRWPPAKLIDLGFAPARALRSGEVGAVALETTGPPDDRWPRRVGIPRKRPLW
jgi:16S rRNA (guanine527-N7)-methyltransferase